MYVIYPCIGSFLSGQVRSECLTCTFRVSCCSARLSGAQVPAFASSSVRDRKLSVGDGKTILRSVDKRFSRLLSDFQNLFQTLSCPYNNALSVQAWSPQVEGASIRYPRLTLARADCVHVARPASENHTSTPGPKRQTLKIV